MKSTDKTIQDWYSYLVSPYGQKILNNVHNGSWVDVNSRQLYSLLDVIGNTFDWSTSPEGPEYWDKVHDEAATWPEKFITTELYQIY